MAKTVGLSCEISRNTGTYAAPVWDAIDDARDVTLNLEAAEADASTRGGSGWREMLQGLKDASIDLEIVANSADADFAAIQAAFFSGTNVEILALDGPQATTGSQGLRAVCVVSGFTRNEPLEDTVTISVTLRPTPNDDAVPSWHTVP